MNNTPKKPEKLRVFTWGFEWLKALDTSVSQQFTQNTGIKIEYEIAKQGLILPNNLLDALKNSAKPAFDVIWSNDVVTMNLAKQGFCEELDTDTLPNLNNLKSDAKPDAFDRWYMVNVYWLPYVLVYRKAAFPGGAPQSWSVLSESRHQGKIAFYPGGKGIYPIAQLLGGGTIEDIPDNMDACWNYLKSIKNQVNIFDITPPLIELFRNAELNLCFRVIPDANILLAEQLDVSWTIPKEGSSSAADVMWVPKYLPDNISYWAKQYINFAIAAQPQETWCRMLEAISVHPQVADRFSSTKIFHVAQKTKMRYEQEWMAKCSSIFTR